MELNREQIVKALECCTSGINHKGDIPCLDCPYDECNIVGGTSERQITGTCQSWLKKDALSLIKELTEENERLKKDNEYILMQHAFQRRPSGDCWNDVIEKAKADTVRKMQEQIKAEIERFDKRGGYAFITKDVVFFFIDQIAKEMLEDL